MFGNDARYVIVHDDHFVDEPIPLRGEHADGRGPATDPHAVLHGPVDDGRPAGFDGDRRTIVDYQFHRFLVAEVHQRLAGGAPFLLGAAGQVMDAAQGEHLRTVFAGHDKTHGLAVRPDCRALRS